MPGKKKLLLVHPISRYREGFVSNRTSMYPPLGLAIVAALTPPDWEVELLDEYFDDFEVRNVDLVAMTAFTANVPRAYELAAQFKERGIPTVLGGIHATMYPDEVATYFDVVVTGEAESIWKTVISDFEAGRLQKRYQGEFLPMEQSPPPRHDLFNPGYYFASIQTTRGCPMDCDFCTVSAMNGRRYRHRPVADVLDELEACKKKLIFFVDDNICGYSKKSEAHAIAIFQGIIDRGIKIDWFSQASINFADNPKLMQLAAKSGCKLILLGIESDDVDQLEKAHKELNVKRGVPSYSKVFKRIQRHGIAVIGTFIYGWDTDTEQTMQRRTNFIRKSRVDCYQSTFLTPLPGTRSFEKTRQEGRLLYNDFPRDWVRYHGFEPTIVPPQFKDKNQFESTMKANWKRLYNKKFVSRKFVRTLLNTRKLRQAIWAFTTNFHYYSIVFEEERKNRVPGFEKWR